MGFLDGLKGLFGARPSMTAAAAAPAESKPAPSKPEGIEGGGNMAGRLMFEPTSDLRDVGGYGRAGTYDVGEWQETLLTNPFVTMAMDHILRPVADARVDVEPPSKDVIGTGPGKLSQADADLHTAFVKWVLTEKFPVQQLNKPAAQGALLSGFSLFEPLADECVCPLVQGRTVWALRETPQRLPNSLDPSSPWLIDENGRLRGIRQLGPRGMQGQWVRPVIDADRALLFSWKRDAGNFAGVSQLRSCWYLANRVMPRLMKMVGVTLQREGPGVPVLTCDDPEQELTPEQQTEVIETFANLAAHEASGMVLPAGWKLEWSVSPAANKGHILDVVQRMGMFILQQFGAQQLMLGVNETGSRSVGETHDARSMAMVREVLTFLANVLNGVRGEADGLVKRLIDWNFGPQPAYPKVKLTPQRPEMAVADLATALKTGKDAGVFTPTLADENAFRERAGVGPITEEERAKEKEARAALAPQLPVPQGDEDRPADGAGEEDVPPPAAPKGASNLRPSPKLQASAQRGGWVPWRPLRASEQRMELARIDDFFTRAREEYERRTKPEVLAMLAMAAPAIQAAMADGKVTPEEVAAVPLDTARLTKLNAEFLAEVRKKGAAFAREELRGAKLTAAAEDEQDDKGSAAEAIVEEADEVVEAQQKALTRRQLNRVRGELERESIDVLRTGGDAAEVIARTVRRQVETGAFKADAGTVTAKIFSVGRDEAARLMGGVAEVELTAILDSATCEVCRNLDGTRAAFNSPEHDRLLPPVRDCAGGDSCRCLLTFIPAENE